MQKIITFLWFDHEAEEAARFYTSLFTHSRITQVTRYPEGGPAPAGKAMTVKFELDGQEFLALNGGPQYQFTEAISLLVNCEGQDEVDRLWERLTDGGEPGQCGWLKDRWGLSWQIIPEELPALISDPDPERSRRAVMAMLAMQKIDIQNLREAAAGA
jgi:predicted 3-demethylubiquinone-9 3-methyltransferase (glyoxalase superfamily)